MTIYTVLSQDNISTYKVSNKGGEYGQTKRCSTDNDPSSCRWRTLGQGLEEIKASIMLLCYIWERDLGKLLTSLGKNGPMTEFAQLIAQYANQREVKTTKFFQFQCFMRLTTSSLESCIGWSWKYFRLASTDPRRGSWGCFSSSVSLRFIGFCTVGEEESGALARSSMIASPWAIATSQLHDIPSLDPRPQHASWVWGPWQPRSQSGSLYGMHVDNKPRG